MNNQLQIPWAQPCEEIIPISRSNFMIAVQKKIQQVTCQINKLDQFANLLSSPFASQGNHAQKGFSSRILR